MHDRTPPIKCVVNQFPVRYDFVCEFAAGHLRHSGRLYAEWFLGSRGMQPTRTLSQHQNVTWVGHALGIGWAATLREVDTKMRKGPLDAS